MKKFEFLFFQLVSVKILFDSIDERESERNFEKLESVSRINANLLCDKYFPLLTSLSYLSSSSREYIYIYLRNFQICKTKTFCLSISGQINLFLKLRYRVAISLCIISLGGEEERWSANPFSLLVDSSRSMNRCRSHEAGINFPRFASYWSCLTSTIVWKGWRSNGSNDSSSFRHGLADFFSSPPSLFSSSY